ncbi:hypothetical protein Pmani_011926 [Petrolisthes manimaculis]|uniref:RNA-directed DNA polymerase n=1 Tax=Petrolisthes manimaculis TaxID=1843537 RepID=A0AAE1Q1X1_9EUCA|nr:hypothetical protein Pmani_016752 [Petrolisthes manimaculis]KAK4316962.1 hypothetical protein Pmani_011926 [Petrolisthes manimaculis]
MERQLEALTDLLMRQAEAAQRAQEEGQRREERLNQLLERMVVQQTSQSTSRTGSDDASSSSNTSTHGVRYPASAATTPHLTSSASLREFDAWRHKFEGYVTLTKINMLTRTEQRAALTAVLDDEWTRTLRYGISVPEDADLGSILDAMEEYLRNQRNIIVDRRDFYLRVQEAGESFDDFLCLVKEIANFCDFCDKCVDSQLRDRIVVGTSDEVALKRMLENKNLTLENAIDICRASESANHCSAVIKGASHSSTHVVNRVSSYRKSHKRDNTKTVRMKSTLCFRCGKDCRKDEQGCRAVDKVCRNCGKRGHFAAVCRQKSSNRSASPRYGGGAKVYQLLAGVYTKQVTARPAPRVVVKATHPAGRDSITWTPDSGAETTVMGFDTAASLGIQTSWLKPAGKESLYAAGNHPLTCLGTFPSRLELGSRQAETVVSVVKEVKGALLSWYDSIALGILPENFPAQIRPLQGQYNSNSTKLIPTPPQKTTSTSTEVVNWPYTYDPTPQQRTEHAAAVINAFPRVFGKDNMLREMVGGPMHIELTDDARPFSVTAPRIIPYSWREEIKQQLDDLLDKGIIEKVDYPTSWCHPIVPVPKKQSGVRLCVDLTRLNRYVKRPVYPVRSPHDAIASVGPEAAWFTTLDAKMGYFQIKIAEEDQDLTCFITPWGRYKFRRAVMGLVSSGDEYNRRGDQALGDVPNTIKVVDDILVYDSTYSAHLDHVIQVVQRCDQHGITLNPDKFVFGEAMVDYCGYTISRLGYTTDSRKVKAISEFPRPLNITDLRSFMGLTNQLGAFSSAVAEAAQPLRDLLRPKNEWNWSTQHEQAFEKDPVECDETGDDPEIDPLHAAVISSLHATSEEGIRLAPLKDQTLEKVRAAAGRDTEYTMLKDIIINGFPEHRHELDHRLRAYWPVRSLLATDDDFIVYGPRLLIPLSLRRETLERLHDGHQGMERTKRRARQTTYWPAHHRSFSPQWQLAADDCDAKADHLREKAKIHHDSSARSLPLLHLGGYVDVQDHANGRWDRVGVIVGIGQRRDYRVKMGSGRILWRNRRFLRPHRPMTPVGVKGQDTHHTITPQQPDPEEHHNLELPQRRGSRQRREPQRLKVQWHASTYD